MQSNQLIDLPEANFTAKNLPVQSLYPNSVLDFSAAKTAASIIPPAIPQLTFTHDRNNDENANQINSDKTSSHSMVLPSSILLRFDDIQPAANIPNTLVPKINERHERPPAALGRTWTYQKKVRSPFASKQQKTSLRETRSITKLRQNIRGEFINDAELKHFTRRITFVKPSRTINDANISTPYLGVVQRQQCRKDLWWFERMCLKLFADRHMYTFVQLVNLIQKQKKIISQSACEAVTNEQPLLENVQLMSQLCDDFVVLERIVDGVDKKTNGYILCRNLEARYRQKFPFHGAYWWLANIFARRAAQLAQTGNDQYSRAAGAFHHAELLQFQHYNLEEALKFYQIAYENCLEDDDWYLAELSLNNTAITDDPSKVPSLYLRTCFALSRVCLELAASSADKSRTARDLELKKVHDQMVHYCELAVRYAIDSNSSQLLVTAQINLALAYVRSGELDTAQALVAPYCASDRKESDVNSLFLPSPARASTHHGALRVLAFIDELRGDYSAALQTWQSFYDSYGRFKLNDFDIQYEYFLCCGRLCCCLTQYDIALIHFNQALDLIRKRQQDDLQKVKIFGEARREACENFARHEACVMQLGTHAHAQIILPHMVGVVDELEHLIKLPAEMRSVGSAPKRLEKLMGRIMQMKLAGSCVIPIATAAAASPPKTPEIEIVVENGDSVRESLHEDQFEVTEIKKTKSKKHHHHKLNQKENISKWLNSLLTGALQVVYKESEQAAFGKRRQSSEEVSSWISEMIGEMTDDEGQSSSEEKTKSRKTSFDYRERAGSWIDKLLIHSALEPRKSFQPIWPHFASQARTSLDLSNTIEENEKIKAAANRTLIHSKGGTTKKQLQQFGL